MNQPSPPSTLVSRPRRGGVLAEGSQRHMDRQREDLLRRRWMRLLIFGGVISILLHVMLMILLGSIYRWLPGGAGVESVTYEFAILQEEELTQFEEILLDDMSTEKIVDLTDFREESIKILQPEIPAVEMEFADSGSMSTLGGSGEGEGFGLSGGGSGTSFFGVSSKGTSFAYIVDKSGSMSDGLKMAVAKREMVRSIQALPDYAQFYIVMFSSNILMPTFQDGWMRARKSMISRVIRWLNNEVDPRGGTAPRTAFLQVFSLETRPDVIFFLTDGEITSFTAQELAAMNKRGKKVVINTIAFGDPSSQDLLKDIAAQSGGVYRYVPAGGE